MEGRLVIKDCALIAPDGRVRNHVAVVVEGGFITQIAEDTLVPVLPGDWAVQAKGRLLCPGMSDCHARLIGAQIDHGPVAKYSQQEIEVLSAYAIAKSLLMGVTFFVEQLDGSSSADSGLPAMISVARRMGSRMLLSYASTTITDVEQNISYAATLSHDSLLRGSIGLKSSMLCTDEVLRAASRGIDQQQLTCHLGLAREDADLAHTVARNFTRVVNRYDSFGLLTGGSVCFSSDLLVKSELNRLIQSRVLLALTPSDELLRDSNATLVSEQMLSTGSLLGLGTAGVGTLLENASLAHAKLANLVRLARAIDTEANLFRLGYEGPSELITMLWGSPSGSVSVGSLADLVLYNDVFLAQQSVTLLDILRARVAWTIVNGVVLVREGELLKADFCELSIEAKKVRTHHHV